MKGLFIKDIRLMTQQKGFFFMLIFITFLLTFNSNSNFVSAYLTFVSSAFVLSTISYDEYDNGFAFLMTLPISRKCYVIEKYFFGFMVSLCASFIGFIFTSIFQRNQNMTESLTITLLCIPLFIIYISVTTPFILKYGNEKARTIMFATFGLLFALGFLTSKLVKLEHIDIGQAIESLSNIKPGTLGIVFFVAAVIITLFSIILSTAIMEKREF